MKESDSSLLSVDEVLRTTRAIRKRLDLQREVPTHLLSECVELATHAPSRRNHQHWRFVVVQDARLKSAVAKHYREAWYDIDRSGHDSYEEGDPRRVNLPSILDSARYLADHLHEVPALVIPCVLGRLEAAPNTAAVIADLASVLPAVWTFMLAARARNLGTTLTTTHLAREREVSEILGIPYGQASQVALLPVAFIKGGALSAGARLPVDSFVSWDGWAAR